MATTITGPPSSGPTAYVDGAPTGVYNPQFQFTFTNEAGNLIDIQILGLAFTGTLTQLTGGSNPVQINYPTETDRTKGIRGSECILSFMSQTGFTLYDIYTQDERQYQVIVKIDGVPYWTGFIINDFSSEPFQEIGTYEVTIKATCGLGGLSGFKFLNQSGYYLFGYISVTALLSLLLQKTGLQLNYYTGVNIYETRHNTSLNALDQTFINVQRFFGSDGLPMQCDQVLESLCQTFGAIIFQRAGAWFFVRQAEMPQLAYYYYSYAGAARCASAASAKSRMLRPTRC